MENGLTELTISSGYLHDDCEKDGHAQYGVDGRRKQALLVFDLEDSNAFQKTASNFQSPQRFCGLGGWTTTKRLFG